MENFSFGRTLANVMTSQKNCLYISKNYSVCRYSGRSTAFFLKVSNLHCCGEKQIFYDFTTKVILNLSTKQSDTSYRKELRQGKS